MAMKSTHLKKVAVFTCALCLALPGAANAGVITINDLTDTLSVTADTDVGARLTGVTILGETVTFEIRAPANAATFFVPDVSNLNILESDGTVSDTLQVIRDITAPVTFWRFNSDNETPLQLLPNARSIVEDGTAQTGFTIAYLDANLSVFDSDTIQFKSDPIPEPSSGVLAVIGLAMTGFMFRGSINRARQG
jgi:hypothetical protein